MQCNGKASKIAIKHYLNKKCVICKQAHDRWSEGKKHVDKHHNKWCKWDCFDRLVMEKLTSG